MMKKDKLKTITLIVLLLVDVILCMLCVNYTQENKPTVNNKEADCIVQLQTLQKEFMISIFNDNLVISSNIVVVNENNILSSIKDITADSVKLFLRIKESHGIRFNSSGRNSEYAILFYIRLFNEN